MITRVFLSRRDLLDLLRRLGAEDYGNTIIKYSVAHPRFPQSMPSCHITAVEDEEYYAN